MSHTELHSNLKSPERASRGLLAGHALSDTDLRFVELILVYTFWVSEESKVGRSSKAEVSL